MIAHRILGIARASAACALCVAAVAQGAAAQVKLDGKEVMLSNKSIYQSSLGDLPPPPALAAPPAAPPNAAPKAGGPGTYCNSFTCIPDSASADPAPEKSALPKLGQFAIHGNSPSPPPKRMIRPRN